MNVTRGLGILLFIIFYNQFCFSQSLRFDSEKITIEVRSDKCILTGIYYFVNCGKELINQTLFYPFFVDELLPLPETYYVRNYKNSNLVKSGKIGNGIVFPIEILPGDTAVIEVQYHQQTLQKRMEYILTTTQTWCKPFNKAEYEVILPLQYRIKEMYPEYDTITKNNNIAVYKTVRKNFMPIKNFTIKWEGVNNEKK